MTTELQVRTITFEPAKVEFNYDQLSAILDENLIKYQGLEFTEKTAGDCKKTITELRKGKTLLDTYRKDTKKQLTESVTAFENQCKELAEKFDDVITPLTEQRDQFEYDRKERKRKEIQDIIDSLITLEGLNEKFAEKLIIPDEYYNKGKSMKAIKTELVALAESLGISQDKEAADVEIIKTKVELANAKYQLSAGLLDTAYIQLLEYESIDSIVEKINADAETIKQREAEVKEQRHQVKSSTKQIQTSPADERFIELYEIEGTEAQLDALEQFLETNGFTWKIVAES